MRQRGRKSAAELALAPVVRVIPRPVAPDHLTDDEAAVWEAYVSSMAAEYFRPSDFDTLANLCRHTVAARGISAWIEKALDDPETTIDDIDRLLRMRGRETRAAVAMARTLRLTKQSQISPRGAAGKQASPTSKPWEG